MQPCAVRREDRIGIAGFVRNDIAVGREVERPGILDGGGGISWSAARRPLAKYLSSEESCRREYHQMFRDVHPPNTSPARTLARTSDYPYCCSLSCGSVDVAPGPSCSSF